MESKKSILREKSYAFALTIVKLNRYLTQNQKEFVLSKQVLSSGTSIGANLNHFDKNCEERHMNCPISVFRFPLC